MIETIYLEDGVEMEARARKVVERFPEATLIHCDRYTEVFNPAAQNFRLQKRRPALIIARKRGTLVHETPAGLEIGDGVPFYFSHMLNCLYDCRYCFLQGMFRSANYVFFVNFEDFQQSIDDARDAAGGARTYFFSGYDCDSLALEALTGFAAEFVPFFAARPDAVLELRTKSTVTRPLLRTQAVPNVVIAYSFTPPDAADSVEHGAPGVAARVAAIGKIAAAGWPVGIRLDPLLWYDGWRQGYASLIDTMAAAIPAAAVHSISIGPLRFPHDMYQRIESMYPDEPVLAAGLGRRGSLVSYNPERESTLREFVKDRVESVFPSTKLFTCSAPQ